MSTRKDEIFFEYSRKLKELDFLWSNPLRPFASSEDLETIKNGQKPRNIENSDIESEKEIELKDIRRLKCDLTAGLHKYLQSHENEEETRKRPVKETPEPARKSQKTSSTDLPSRKISKVRSSQDNKAGSKNLESQIANLEHETNEFLNRKISDVDVVTLPEHLPTEVHNVLSLAELYYLTQTLPLIKLLPGTHKTLMTENFELAILEGKVAVLFSRIEELKRLKKWSLRQPIRYYDPFVYAKRNKKAKLFSWDYVLQEGKWMAADFKETTKYKKLCCVTMAQAVQDFWAYGKVMCVNRKPIKHLPEVSRTGEPRTRSSMADSMDIDLNGASISTESLQTADQIVLDDNANPSSEIIEGQEDEPQTIDISKLLERPNPADEIEPHKLPEYLAQDLVNAGIDVKNKGPFKAHVNLHELKKIDLSIIRNLPKFTAFDDTESRKPIPTGETAIVPVSRMLYPMEDDDEWHKIVLRDSRKPQKSTAPANGLPEYQKGLFGVQSHRRLNFLRPPKPPLVKNIEFRSPTIWLPQDDKYLIHYVAEYCFNWDLIAENLHSNASTLKRYESNIERRTPWQCFERYIQLNEKFQFSDMKGINAYLAQQWLEQAHKAQLTTKRRISPLGVGNESIQRGHRRLRWASMFDAMRKTMRKRETAAAKASTRKNTALPDITASSSTSTSSGVNSNGASASKRASDKIPTPSELSKLKFERDKSIQEAFIHQQATRSKMMAAVNQQKHLTELPHPALSPGLGGPTDMTGTSMQRRVSQAPGRAPGSVLSSPRLQRPQAARPSPQQAGVASAQGGALVQQNNKQPIGNFKRPTTPNGTPLTVEQIQRLLQIQKQRRLMQQQQQQQQQQQGNVGNTGLASGTASSVASSQNPLARKPMASSSIQVPVSQNSPTNGIVGSSVGGVVPGNQSIGAAGSLAKRGVAPSRGRMQFPPAQVSAIINSIQQKNPNLTKDQVTKLAASYLANLQQQQQNKLELQTGRPATAGESATSTQQSLQARQAQLSRQRLAAQTSAGLAAKEADAQTLSKMQYEERKRLMMQQGGSQFGQSSTQTVSKPAGTQTLKSGTKAAGKSSTRSQSES